MNVEIILIDTGRDQVDFDVLHSVHEEIFNWGN